MFRKKRNAGGKKGDKKKNKRKNARRRRNRRGRANAAPRRRGATTRHTTRAHIDHEPNWTPEFLKPETVLVERLDGTIEKLATDAFAAERSFQWKEAVHYTGTAYRMRPNKPNGEIVHFLEEQHRKAAEGEYDIRFKEFPDIGLGVVANRDLPANTIIAWYPGRLRSTTNVTRDSIRQDQDAYCLYVRHNQALLRDAVRSAISEGGHNEQKTLRMAHDRISSKRTNEHISANRTGSSGRFLQSAILAPKVDEDHYFRHEDIRENFSLDNITLEKRFHCSLPVLIFRTTTDTPEGTNLCFDYSDFIRSQVPCLETFIPKTTGELVYTLPLRRQIGLETHFFDEARSTFMTAEGTDKVVFLKQILAKLSSFVEGDITGNCPPGEVLNLFLLLAITDQSSIRALAPAELYYLLSICLEYRADFEKYVRGARGGTGGPGFFATPATHTSATFADIEKYLGEGARKYMCEVEHTLLIDTALNDFKKMRIRIAEHPRTAIPKILRITQDITADHPEINSLRWEPVMSAEDGGKLQLRCYLDREEDQLLLHNLLSSFIRTPEELFKVDVHTDYFYITDAMQFLNDANQIGDPEKRQEGHIDCKTQ